MRKKLFLSAIAFVIDLVNRSRFSLHDMFTRTYGMLYEQHAKLFTDLFDDLLSYAEGHDLDLLDVMDRFFVDLMRRMFALVNDVRPADLSDQYASCMTGHIDRLRPFGDVPGKLAAQVKRTFVAVKVLAGGLAVGRDVSTGLAKVGNVHLNFEPCSIRMNEW